MSLDPARVVAQLHELQQLTGDENGAQRVAWTATWNRARTWLDRLLDGVLTPPDPERLTVALVSESEANRVRRRDRLGGLVHEYSLAA